MGIPIRGVFSGKRSDRDFDSFKGRGRGTGRNQGTPMAKLQLTDVEIFVKDLKATRAFYTRKFGLKVRSAMPKWGYLALGATKGGEDAALTPWQPVPEWGQEMYESRLKMIGESCRKALGMRKQRAESDEEGFDSYQLSPKATAITPFTPRKDIYDNPADYDADMAHIGEETGIGFTTSDIYRLQEQLLAKGVRFKEKAEAQDWGGIRARFFDLDDNVYSLVEYKG